MFDGIGVSETDGRTKIAANSAKKKKSQTLSTFFSVKIKCPVSVCEVGEVKT